MTLLSALFAPWRFGILCLIGVVFALTSPSFAQAGDQQETQDDDPGWFDNFSFDSDQWDIAGELAAELRVFPRSPAFQNQDKTYVSPSVRFEPELYYEWNDGQDLLTLTPFLRWDHDDRQRNHIDIRQANWLHIGDSWDMVVGIEQIFWGVTESAHLVDIINQIDQLEDLDNEDKLGQPMININLERDSGTYSLFVMPGFRKRPFPQDRARLRGSIPVDWRQALFTGGARPGHIDLAGRWATSLGDWDIGLSHFYGVSREPLMQAIETSAGPRLRPVYRLIHQSGFDVQYTTGAWLWKVEAITRSGHGKRFAAAVGGFEYTLFGIADTTKDLGLLMEIQLDGRSQTTAPVTLGDNDIFIGSRLAFNDEEDTAILAGGIIDWQDGTTLATVEAERRIAGDYGIEVIARLFFSGSKANPVHSIRNDDFISLNLIRHF